MYAPLGLSIFTRMTNWGLSPGKRPTNVGMCSALAYDPFTVRRAVPVLPASEKVARSARFAVPPPSTTASSICRTRRATAGDNTRRTTRRSWRYSTVPSADRTSFTKAGSSSSPPFAMAT